MKEPRKPGSEGPAPGKPGSLVARPGYEVGYAKPPEGSAGLRYYEIVVPDAEARAQIRANVEQANAPVEEREGRLFFRDPAGNGIAVTS